MVEVIKYNSVESVDKINKILSRTQLDYGNCSEIVSNIISDVKAYGDEALFKYTSTFDKVDLDKESIKVSDDEIKKAYSLVDEQLLSVIRKAIARVRDFHEKQKQNSWFEPDLNGEIMGQIIRPIEKVGVYVPGGKAFYPSTVIMDVVPAVVAGVSNIIMTTPFGVNGVIAPASIVTAVESGVSEIYKVGGAQAIAAMAYGTKSIPKVDKIVGPGNIYVALAKRSVYGYVDIDSVAGPSEILIIADASANAAFVAADMLSQAEHDELAASILITSSSKLAYDVLSELTVQTNYLSRKDIITKSFSNFGAIIVVEDINDAFELSNSIAPEHLELCINEPFSSLSKIKNAGAIFLGHFTPEPLGDYMAGPNHVLPTGGTSRFFSPLNIDDFVKKSSIISFSKEAFFNICDDVILFANAEGLTAHANAVEVRKTLLTL